MAARVDHELKKLSLIWGKTSENLANIGTLRARLSLKQTTLEEENVDEYCRPWRRRFSFMAFSWGSGLRITLLLLLVAAISAACYTLPVEKVRTCSSLKLTFHRSLAIWSGGFVLKFFIFGCLAFHHQMV